VVCVLTTGAGRCSLSRSPEPSNLHTYGQGKVVGLGSFDHRGWKRICAPGPWHRAIGLGLDDLKRMDLFAVLASPIGGIAVSFPSERVRFHRMGYRYHGAVTSFLDSNTKRPGHQRARTVSMLSGLFVNTAVGWVAPKGASQ
jgi:hypothetical protein